MSQGRRRLRVDSQFLGTAAGLPWAATAKQSGGLLVAGFPPSPRRRRNRPSGPLGATNSFERLPDSPLPLWLPTAAIEHLKWVCRATPSRHSKAGFTRCRGTERSSLKGPLGVCQRPSAGRVDQPVAPAGSERGLQRSGDAAGRRNAGPGYTAD